MSGLAELQVELFRHEISVKLFHFLTKSYGGHKQADAYLAKFLELADQLMEILQGIVGSMHIDRVELSVKAPSDRSFPRQVLSFVHFLRQLDLPSEAGAIVDQMIGNAEQLLYVLEFK